MHGAETPPFPEKWRAERRCELKQTKPRYQQGNILEAQKRVGSVLHYPLDASFSSTFPTNVLARESSNHEGEDEGVLVAQANCSRRDRVRRTDTGRRTEARGVRRSWQAAVLLAAHSTEL